MPYLLLLRSSILFRQSCDSYQSLCTQQITRTTDETYVRHDAVACSLSIILTQRRHSLLSFLLSRCHDTGVMTSSSASVYDVNTPELHRLLVRLIVEQCAPARRSAYDVRIRTLLSLRYYFCRQTLRIARPMYPFVRHVHVVYRNKYTHPQTFHLIHQNFNTF